MKTNLGPLDENKCKTCGRKHHLYAWPQKCYENSVRDDNESDIRHDKRTYAEMSQEERDAHDNF